MATAEDALETIKKLSEIHDKNISRLPETVRKTDNVRAVFDYLEKYPIIDIKTTASKLDLSYNTVSSAVKKMQELGILKEANNASRNRTFIYEEYLSVLRKDTEVRH